MSQMITPLWWLSTLLGLLWIGYRNTIHTKYRMALKTILSLGWFMITCYGCIHFEHYLHHLVIGHQDLTGKTILLDTNGWPLLLRAWPLWLGPLCMVISLQCILQVLTEYFSLPMPKPSYSPNPDLTQKCQELSQQLETAIHQNTLLQQQLSAAMSHTTSEDTTTTEPKSSKISELRKIIQAQKHEINEANLTIDALLKQLATAP